MIPQSFYLFILLFSAVGIGWFVGFYFGRDNQKHKEPDFIPSIDYLLAQSNDITLKKLLAAPNIEPDAIELYIKLGRSLRHKGDVERAINLHQSLFAKAGLPKSILLELELELAIDFLRAGLFDRAERLLLELIDHRGDVSFKASQYLLELYEEEGSWQRILDLYAQKKLPDADVVQQRVAHACCEMASKRQQQHDYLDAHKILKKALKINSSCARSYVLQGQLAQSQNEPSEAIRCYLKAVAINPNAIIYLLPNLVQAFETLEDRQGLLQHLNEYWHRSQYVEVLAHKTRIEAELYGPYRALENLIHILKQHPTDKGFFILIDLVQKYKLNMDLQGTLELHQLIKTIAEQAPSFACKQCGFKGKQPHWQCPSCKAWSSIEPLKSNIRRLTEDAYDSF